MFKRIKLGFLLIFLFSCLAAFSQNNKNPQNLIMILGSDDPSTLEERTTVAFNLYQLQKDIDKIIVSGGCGAHDSSICEAEDMKEKLTKLGVPEDVIVKEEKSQTTLQNYIYSRLLKDESRGSLIKEGDKLYVVSNHWHAISVANRFREFDGVNAEYFVSGNLLPKEKDLVDYVGIFYGYPDQEELLSKFLSDNIMTASYIDGHLVLVNQMGAIGYQSKKNADKKLLKVFRTIGQDNFKDKFFFDAAKNSFFFLSGEKILELDRSGRLKTEYSFQEFFKGFSSDGNSITKVDAVSIVDSKILIFEKENLWIGKRKNGGFEFQEKVVIKDYIRDWPFSWGSGDVDAAVYIESSDSLRLFRGTQFMDVSLSTGKVIEKPSKLNFNDFKKMDFEE